MKPSEIRANIYDYLYKECSFELSCKQKKELSKLLKLLSNTKHDLVKPIVITKEEKEKQERIKQEKIKAIELKQKEDKKKASKMVGGIFDKI